MKLGSTRFWVSASALLFAATACPTVGGRPQEAAPPHAQEKARVSPERTKNEITLAGVRPGRDSYQKLVKLMGAPVLWDKGEPARWVDNCRRQMLLVDFDAQKKVQVMRVERYPSQVDCEPPPPSPWRTGRGLRLQDACSQAAALYGKPDSRSPSTKGGQPLQLLYYAFDWAGPEVPQVMQVVCTAEENGQPGRVVEITLAASSL